MSSTSKGWILLSHGHEALPEINEAGILDALPPALRDGPRDRVHIQTSPLPEDRTRVDWAALQREQAAQVAEGLLDARNRCRGVAYFGQALLPLAMDLGFRVQSWVPSRAFLFHRNQRDWRWPGRPSGARPYDVQVKYHGFPSEQIPSSGPVVVRVSVTSRIAVEDTRAVVPDPRAEVDIHLGDACGVDALATSEDLERVVDAFQDVLYQVRERLPAAGPIHVFTAAPAGLAFRMGCVINPTVHALVQTYQFFRNAPVKYQKALIVGAEVKPDMVLEIQFLAAEPRATARLRIGEELREIAHSRRDGEHRDRFTMAEPRFATRTRDLQSYIRRESAHIVHVSGHGEPGGVLVLEDGVGNPERVRPEAMRMLFDLCNEDGHLRCAVFNACHSHDLARVLTREPAVVPCVVATTDAVSDPAAIAFSEGFYGALADGETLARAFKAGKVQVGLRCAPACADLFELFVADEAMRDKPLFTP